MRADAAILRREVHQRLLRDLPVDVTVDRATVADVVSAVAPLTDRAIFEQVVSDVLADVHGLGVLEELMADPKVTDVMVVGGRGIWIEKHGKIIDTGRSMSTSEITHLIERVVAPLGLRIDRSSPMIDARLPDGSRVNAIVAPLAVDGPCLTIRRFGAQRISIEKIAAPAVAKLLIDAVRSKMNIVVSGGTGSGKTTLLNAMAGHIAPHERVITIEDAAELRLPLQHVVRLEGRPANTEGAGHVSLRDLVRNALRMRPDRIIVGEVRGPEALDMLQAMNSGHEGSMSTCHANNCFDALRRIETMVLMGETALPLDAVRQQIVSSVDLIVQIARRSDGTRAVESVSEVVDNSSVPVVREIANATSVCATTTRLARTR